MLIFTAYQLNQTIMKTLLHITTQTKENYSSIESPHWKNKGAQMFSVNVDSDVFMYAESECITTIKTLLAKRSNNMFSYEYIDHELIFMGVEVLDDSQFETELQNVCNEAYYLNEQAEINKAINRYEQGLGID